jgi:hypothetical protein
MKVVEFFKIYNIVLGLKLKTQSLQLYMLNFEQRWNLNYLCPYQRGFDQIFDTFANVHGMS